MKQTFLTAFLFFIWLTMFSCANPKEKNSHLTAIEENASDSLECIETSFFKMDTLKQIPTDLNPDYAVEIFGDKSIG